MVNYTRNARFPYLFFKEQQSPGPSCQSSKQLLLLAGAVLQGGAQRVPFSSPAGCPPTLSRWLCYRSWHLLRSSAVYVVTVSQAGSSAARWHLCEIMRNAENVLVEEQGGTVDSSVVGGWRAVSLSVSLQTRPKSQSKYSKTMRLFPEFFNTFSSYSRGPLLSGKAQAALAWLWPGLP